MSRVVTTSSARKIRRLRMSEVEFSIEALPEDITVEGNFVDSGDEKFDRECAEKIYKELARGNQWAWCTVKVTAKWRGHEGTNYLGACSYENEEDFINSGYYEDMKSEALDELNDKITEESKVLSALEEKVCNCNVKHGMDEICVCDLPF